MPRPLNKTVSYGNMVKFMSMGKGIHVNKFNELIYVRSGLGKGQDMFGGTI